MRFMLTPKKLQTSVQSKNESTLLKAEQVKTHIQPHSDLNVQRKM